MYIKKVFSIKNLLKKVVEKYHNVHTMILALLRAIAAMRTGVRLGDVQVNLLVAPQFARLAEGRVAAVALEKISISKE